MHVSSQLARHFRDTYFGGNWTSVNLKEALSDVNWQQAIAPLEDCNTIAGLVFHIGYYVNAVLPVLEGGALKASDKYSFDLPAIQSADDWEALLSRTWREGERFADLVAQLPEERLWENLADEKYGNYYRNIHGIIEHAHYHLGQIVLLKKMLRLKEAVSSY
jgi:uncharacterized damage-inducible protein DinB